ncbi:hypothetical protein SAMN05216490_1083 [Mucilaginibacter mallensis]|uniref:Uncharacterized protein n=1 Tax=Mucilaginibacter mallensis TaxID=652787 RepID=A0A1H1RVT5_MUCMA|nr:hypothetical protein [Mucilaginibacter mallensis]SDS39881.1 hypothetical protein SAMN05216490_1083 [Mucilaginibacter mallensis]
MSRTKKLNIIIPIVIVLFVGAYARHKYDEKAYDIVGTLPNKQLDEISGIAASGINKDIYYIHNDSGDTSRFFAIHPDGKLKTTIYFKGDPKEGQGVHDCEDIAVGPGPVKGKSYVYDGDIGDNFAVRNYITVYRVEEKTSWIADSTQNVNAEAVPIHFRYPDGPKDAETLMIDPMEKLIYIISKRKDTVGVYTSPLIYKPNDTLVLTKRCKLFFPGIKPFKWITAGDISKDGQQILVKDYVKVYYWKRQHNEPVWQTLQRPPRLLPYKMEKQGEAIGFTPDGKGYYTTSEGVYSPIYYYKLGFK